MGNVIDITSRIAERQIEAVIEAETDEWLERLASLPGFTDDLVAAMGAVDHEVTWLLENGCVPDCLLHRMDAVETAIADLIVDMTEYYQGMED